MTEFKEVYYSAVNYSVPVWVRFLTTDGNGDICGHENQPVLNYGIECWESKGRWFLVAESRDWRNSEEELWMRK